MRRKYVLKNKKRFIVFLVTLLVLSLLSIFATTVYGYKETANKTVVVKSGDTLWSIAQTYCTEGDIRLYIHRIRELNHLPNSDIYQGATLILPGR